MPATTFSNMQLSNSREVGRLETDAQGGSNTLTLQTGTYYPVFDSWMIIKSL